jgi:hypothetical protein
MKPFESVLRRGEGSMRDNEGGVEPNQSTLSQ